MRNGRNGNEVRRAAGKGKLAGGATSPSQMRGGPRPRNDAAERFASRERSRGADNGGYNIRKITARSYSMIHKNLIQSIIQNPVQYVGRRAVSVSRTPHGVSCRASQLPSHLFHGTRDVVRAQPDCIECPFKVVFTNSLSSACVVASEQHVIHSDPHRSCSGLIIF